MKPLNPIMAVLAIASVGVFPLRALAADGSKPAGVVIADAETSSVDAMTKILKENTAARAEAGKRISEFLLEDFTLPNNPAKRSFVASGTDAETRRLIGVLANEWGATQGSPEEVAVLYFVIGPGAATPSWAPATFKPGMQWLLKVRSLLSDPDKGDWAGKSQIGGTTYKQQVAAFLNASVGKSWSALDPRTKVETGESVENNDNTGDIVPDTTPGRGSHLNGAMQQYTLKDLYLDGAQVAEVSGPKDEHSRRISMKIYTKRLPDGSIENEIGIFDITDEGNIYGRRFPVGGPDQSFVLDDRTPGHKKYELKFETLPGGDRKIVFGRPGGGVTINTKVSELYLGRADQAADLKNIISIGGKEFYVVPQGGALGAVAMFPKALIDARGGPGQDPRNLIPQLYAEIGKRADRKSVV